MEWSIFFIIAGYIVPIVWFVIAEAIGLRRAGDRFPPFTHIMRLILGKSWLAVGIVGWFLIWTFIHFFFGIT